MEAFAKRTGHGAAVLVLTNDPAYWLPRSRADTVDAAFDIAEARELAGMLQWSALAGQGTTKGREVPRSEEHTSELRSLMRISYAVFCLKKKTNKQTDTKSPKHKHTPNLSFCKITDHS